MNRQYIAKIKGRNHVIYVKAGFRNKGFVKITEPTNAEIKQEFKRQEKIIENSIKGEKELLRKKQELKKMLNKLRKMRTSRKYE
jgi:hypothetical protein